MCTSNGKSEIATMMHLFLSLLLLVLLIIESTDSFLSTKITTPQSITQIYCSNVDNTATKIYVNDVNFLNAVKEYKNANAPRKLIKKVIEYSDRNELSQNMTAFVYRTLTRMNRTETALELIPLWKKIIDDKVPVDIDATMVLLKGCRRLLQIDLVESIVSSCGLGDYPRDKISNREILISTSGSSGSDVIDMAQLMLPELALGYATTCQFTQSYSTLQLMERLELSIDLDMSKSILKLYLKGKSSETSANQIRSVLKTLLKLSGLNDNDSIQLLTSTYMRTIDFVKGAVSMATLPPAVVTCPEVAFIGRSNVGKSSLINMICNKKGLAFVSKTPGKTSEFNYFLASGNICNSKAQFHLVDLPGVGYAEVRKEMRSGWVNLLKEFATGRETLKAIVHLIDSRHGLLEADEECLTLIDDLPPSCQYIIVLTKADKKGYNRGIADRIRKEIDRRSKYNRIPMILTSSETREGGAALWSVLLDAMANDRSNLLSLEDFIDTDEYK